MGGFLKVLAVFILSMPLSIVATFALGDVWAWFERERGIESVGHAMYAGWCFQVTYAALLFVGLFGLLLISVFKRREPTAR